MITLNDHLRRLNEHITLLTEICANLKAVLAIFPDALVRQEDDDTTRVFSRQANTLASECEIQRKDNTWRISPYVNTELGPIYSDPPDFFLHINQHNQVIMPTPLWRGVLETYKINPAAIRCIENHIEAPNKSNVS